MTKHNFILFLIIFLGCNSTATAQFLNLQLTIEPELSASVEQPLQFGKLEVNSGITSVGLGDLTMGIFSVRAYYTQNVFITLQYPDSLINIDADIDNFIPIELKISYNNSGVDSHLNTHLLANNKGMIAVYDNAENVNQSEVWKNLYVYLYGSLNVGEIENGHYSGEIALSINYD